MLHAQVTVSFAFKLLTTHLHLPLEVLKSSRKANFQDASQKYLRDFANLHAVSNEFRITAVRHVLVEL